VPNMLYFLIDMYVVSLFRPGSRPIRVKRPDLSEAQPETLEDSSKDKPGEKSVTTAELVEALQ